MNEPPVVVERTEARQGELVLRRNGDHFEVISNGTFLMDTRCGESERLLVTAAVAAHSDVRRLLIGGLGVGFSLAAAVATESLERIVVVEIERRVVEWNRTHLAGHNGDALADPRVDLVEADLLTYLSATGERFDVICLDVDNGPEWTVTARNGALYDERGTALVASRLTAGGVLAVWSAARAPSYEAELSRHFDMVAIHEVEAGRGGPDVVIVASKNRPTRCTTEEWQP